MIKIFLKRVFSIDPKLSEIEEETDKIYSDIIQSIQPVEIVQTSKSPLCFCVMDFPEEWMPL